jgi:predicted DNA-binding protein|tara:strand:- start:129 stop:272 length:144 start_codon:yes stop_codon:yes gene_type:complete
MAGPKTPFSIRISRDLLARLRRVSFLKGMPMTIIIERALERYLEQEE